MTTGPEASTRVSVIIPVFERLDYLGESLGSVAAQSVRVAEVIVVTDGDRVDPTAAIMASGVDAKVVGRARGGPGAARNTGCAAASGDILAFLDVDDVWLPHKLEQQLAAMHDAPGVDVVFGGVEHFFSPELGIPGAPERLARAERSGLLPSAMIVGADTFAHVGGFREGVIFGEFLDWYARAVDLGVRAATVDEVVVRRRVHDHNAGVEHRASRGDYVRVIKDVLDRRRAAVQLSSTKPS
jgi:glycosyltransferase involved in cell wall biosynthesis